MNQMGLDEYAAAIEGPQPGEARLSMIFAWPTGSHWCATGRDGEGNVLHGPGTIGRGASKEAAEDDLRRKIGEPT